MTRHYGYAALCLFIARALYISWCCAHNVHENGARLEERSHGARGFEFYIGAITIAICRGALELG